MMNSGQQSKKRREKMAFLNTSHQFTVENSKYLNNTKIPIVLFRLHYGALVKMIDVRSSFNHIVLRVSPRSCRTSNRGQSFIDLTARTANKKMTLIDFTIVILLSGTYLWRIKYILPGK